MCAPRAGKKTELDLRETEPGLRRIADEAIGAGEGDFQAAAECRAVDRRDHRNTQALQPVQQRLARPAEFFAVRGRADLGELLHVGAGDPHAGLPRGDHHGSRHDRARLDSLDDLRHLGDHGG